MNTILWSCVAILTLFVSVESLTCYTCDVSVLGYCFSTENVNCSATQDRCYSGVASFSFDLPDIYSRGCTTNATCEKGNSSYSIFNNINLNMTQTIHCCTSNLCNGAGTGPVTLPLVTALGAALVALGTVSGL